MNPVNNFLNKVTDEYQSATLAVNRMRKSSAIVLTCGGVVAAVAAIAAAVIFFSPIYAPILAVIGTAGVVGIAIGAVAALVVTVAISSGLYFGAKPIQNKATTKYNAGIETANVQRAVECAKKFKEIDNQIEEKRKNEPNFDTTALQTEAKKVDAESAAFYSKLTAASKQLVDQEIKNLFPSEE